MDGELTFGALDSSGYVMPDYDVGPQNNGTFSVPRSAQPTNTPWDSAGGTLGNYGNGVLGILQQGIGAWSQYQRNNQFLDYQRYEATSGGVFTQGRPNPMPISAQVSARTSNPMMLILIVGAAILLLRK